MLTTGSKVGRYLIQRKLAEGGMAEIFLASAVGPEGFAKEVVIKVVRSFLATDSQFVQMFIAEARLASKLNHANVVQIFDFGKHDESYYLAMEYVRGASLWDLRKRCREMSVPFPPTLAAEIGAQVARGMHYAHGLSENGQKIGVVHRDVTPHNVLLSFDGAVKLTDFGIAKATTTQTAPGMLKGKFAYMSPEQSRGEKVDARTDLFALGTVLWELLTGGRLFEGDSDLAILRAVQDSLIPPPSRVNPDVPQELSDVVMKALARPLAERFQSAFELERALATFVLRNAKSVEDTSVASFLQGMFKEEFEAPAPKNPSLDQTLPPDDEFGLGHTVARNGLKTETNTPAPAPTKPERGALDDDDDAPSKRTEEFVAQPARPKTEAMPAMKRPPSRRFDPLPVQEPSVLVRQSIQLPPRPEPAVEPSTNSAPTETAEQAQLGEPPPPRSNTLLFVVLGMLVLGLVIGVAVVGLAPGTNGVTPPQGEPNAEPTAVAAVEPRLVPEPAPVAKVEPPPEATKPVEAIVPDAKPTEPKPLQETKPVAPAPVRKLMGTLAIKAVPFATVTVQGKTHEVTGIQNIVAPVGTYEIVLKHPRKTAKEKVTVQANTVTSVSFSAE